MGIHAAYPDDPAVLAQSALLRQDWYYTIELMPGVFTSGSYGVPTGLTRRLLRNCSVAGRTCLDIGPMEGAVSALLAKRGAHVTAFDIVPRIEQVGAVKHYMGADFEYVAPLTLYEAPAFFRARNTAAFDIVVFSGVLYHVPELLSSLATVRALARPGGLVVVESWLSTRDEMVAYFNHRGTIASDPNTFWLLTVPLFEYLLRWYALMPIDVAYVRTPVADTVRLATTCRVVDRCLPDADDLWMPRTARHGVDFNVSALSTESSERVPYATVSSQQDERIDLQQALRSTPAEEVTEDEAAIRLSNQW